MKSKINVAIIGGGACSLMLGCELNSSLFNVSIYDANVAVGRKFLVAGAGGLNITHSKKPNDFIDMYTPKSFLIDAFNSFNNIDLQHWLKNKLNLSSYIGTSGKVFPTKEIKPIEVLNAFINKSKLNNVNFYNKHTWLGFKNNALLFKKENIELLVNADLVIFCLGGASWPVTGSNGVWLNYFSKHKIETLNFEASNCSVEIKWPTNLINLIEGKHLKNCSFTINKKTINGEVVLTKYGLEGNGIYGLSSLIRENLKKNNSCNLFIDFKPQLSKENLIKKLNESKNNNQTKKLSEILKLNAIQIHLLKHYLTKEEFLNTEILANNIKQFHLSISNVGSIEDAISTVGGISLNEINQNFEFKKLPNHFAIGEMLNYDAPTGGYLLQSCFSMAYFLSNYLNTKYLKK
jgi:uncharacterized flavoprotein (TIGR03862 family)